MICYLLVKCYSIYYSIFIVQSIQKIYVILQDMSAPAYLVRLHCLLVRLFDFSLEQHCS